MSALVGPNGMAAIARGDCYPEAPRPFPQAIVEIQGETRKLTHLFSSRDTNFVPQANQRPFHAIPLVFSVLLASFVSTDPTPIKTAVAAALCFISFYYFYNRQIPASNTIYLSPKSGASFPSIRYEYKVDELLEKLPKDSFLPSELDKNFRNYRLHVFDNYELERRIAALTCKFLSSLQLEDLDESLLSRAEKLFAPYKEDLASYNQVVVIAGGTGVGKSTLINYLCRRKIVAVNSLFLRRPPLAKDDKVLIAENSLVEIGHAIGVGSSQTFAPQFVQDKNSEIVYCDFPGSNENRGFAAAICSQWLAQKALKQAASIRGVLFLMDYGDLIYRKGGNCIEDLRFLNRLLPFYSRESVLFIVTKVPVNASIHQVKQTFKAILQTGRDEIALFCDKILELGALDSQLVICDPCSWPLSRALLIRKIKKLKNTCPSDKFSYPLSISLSRELDRIRLQIEGEIQTILFSLQREVSSYWVGKIAKDCKPYDLMRAYIDLDYLLESVRKGALPLVDELHLIAPILSEDLKKKNLEWEKIFYLQSSVKTFEKFWRPSSEELMRSIRELQVRVDEDYYAQTSNHIKFERSSGIFCAIL